MVDNAESFGKYVWWEKSIIVIRKWKKARNVISM